MSTKNRYTVEFKQEAIKLVVEQNYSIIEASNSLGIPHSNLSRWVSESKGKIIAKTKDQACDLKELEELRRENKRLKMEREILKKAAAFFANEPT
jgi:transposase